MLAIDNFVLARMVIVKGIATTGVGACHTPQNLA